MTDQTTDTTTTDTDPKETNVTTTEPTILDRFELFEDTLNLEIVERRAEIRAMTQALVAGVPMFLLGPPGVAKSMLVNRANAYIDGARKFEVLMTRFTQMEEVFGPVSLSGLKNDEFKRKLDGYLCDANIAFVDEIFKANSSILNAFLWAINEGIYRHDTEIIDIPLHLLLCASNEMPQDDSLGALYDRLLFRFIVNPVRDQSAFITMLKTNIPKNPEPILSWDDVVEAHEGSKKVIIPDVVLDAVGEMRKKLKEAGIEPTERRFVQSMKIVRAAAYLDGCDVADVEHLRPLQHVMWDDQEQIAAVSKVVLAIAAPLDNEAHQLLAEVEKLERSLDSITQDEERHRKGTEIHSKLRRCHRDLNALDKRATGRRRSETLIEVRERLVALSTRVLVEIFKVDEDEAGTVATDTTA